MGACIEHGPLSQNQKEVNPSEEWHPSEVRGVHDHLRLRQCDPHPFHEEEIHVEVCNKCHPFYTGKQKLVDTGGRVGSLQKRFNMQ